MSSNKSEYDLERVRIDSKPTDFSEDDFTKEIQEYHNMERALDLVSAEAMRHHYKHKFRIDQTEDRIKFNM